MRKLLAGLVVVVAMAVGGIAGAEPPQSDPSGGRGRPPAEDPSGGNGANGNAGCQGLSNAPGNYGTNLARLILGCSNGG